MARMHGEHRKDHQARMQFAGERKRATAEYEATPITPVELDVSWQMTCTCSWRPYRHQHPEAQRALWKKDFEKFTRKETP